MLFGKRKEVSTINEEMIFDADYYNAAIHDSADMRLHFDPALPYLVKLSERYGVPRICKPWLWYGHWGCYTADYPIYLCHATEIYPNICTGIQISVRDSILTLPVIQYYYKNNMIGQSNVVLVLNIICISTNDLCTFNIFQGGSSVSNFFDLTALEGLTTHYASKRGIPSLSQSSSGESSPNVPAPVISYGWVCRTAIWFSAVHETGTKEDPNRHSSNEWKRGSIHLPNFYRLLSMCCPRQIGHFT